MKIMKKKLFYFKNNNYNKILLKKFSLFIFIFFFIIISNFTIIYAYLSSITNNVAILKDKINYLKGKIYFFEDKDNNYDFEKIKNSPNIFKIIEDSFPNFGYSKSTYWYRFTLKREKDLKDTFYIEIDYPPIDYITLYYPDENGNYNFYETGDNFPFNKRPYFHRNFIFPIILSDASKDYTFYIKIKTESQAILPIKIYPENQFIKYTYRNNLFIGLFYGVFLIMILYNFFLFLSLKETAYLFYVIHSISYVIYQAIWDGLIFQYFLQNLVYLNNILNPIFMNLTTITSLILLKYYLTIEKKEKIIYFIYKFLLFIGIFITITPIIISYNTGVKLTTFFILPSVIFLIYAGFINYKKGYAYSKYFFIAWSIFLVAIVVNSLRAFKILPTNLFTLQLSIKYGFLFENVLLSLGLAARIDNLLREKLEAQKIMVETLEKTNRLKDEFLANTSHELRTPLNGIIGLAESALEGACGEINENLKNNLKLIVSSGKRLANLINDILDFSRIKNNEIKINLEPTDIYLNIELVISVLKPLIKTKRLKILNYISKDFPFIYADKDRFQQILTNIIGNSIKYTESGFIEIYGNYDENKVYIKISDTGKGIEESRLEKIFENQNNLSDLDKIEGTGIGLPLTKKLVELLKGEIKIESKVNEGTTVTLIFPMIKEKDKNKSYDKEIIEKNKSEYQLLNILKEDVELSNQKLNSLKLDTEKHNYKVLVVDDEIINLQVLINQLALNNYKVITATSGYECLDIINKNEQKIDLIILDIMMPGLNGYEVCTMIRKKYLQTELPIILLTAKNQVSDLIEGFSVGANDFLLKPINKPELLARIKTHIQLSKINEAYQRFVPREFLKQINKENILEVNLGDHLNKNMTILYCDIRDFTSLSENMTPEENFKFINSYLKRVSPVIHKYGGFIDKFIGDAVMALFSEDIHIEDILNCAVEIFREIEIYNIHRAKSSYPQIKIGLSIHKGNLMLGTIGDERRMEGTVIADCVNVASRIENLNRILKTNALISEEIYYVVKDNPLFSFRFIGKFKVKGKEIPIKIYEFLNCYNKEIFNKKIKIKRYFEDFLEHFYKREFDEVKKISEKILLIDPEDEITKLYLDSIQNIEEGKKFKKNIYSFLENVNFFIL